MSNHINSDVALKRVEATFSVSVSIDAETGKVTATVGGDLPSVVGLVTEAGTYAETETLTEDVVRLLAGVQGTLGVLLDLYPNN